MIGIVECAVEDCCGEALFNLNSVPLNGVCNECGAVYKQTGPNTFKVFPPVKEITLLVRAAPNARTGTDDHEDALEQNMTTPPEIETDEGAWGRWDYKRD